MSWFKVDDKFHSHPKTLKAGNAALGLWVRCASWCADQLTDGHIPDEIAELFGTETQAKKLLSAGLWIRVSDGYRMHEYTERNPTRDQVLSQRKANAERVNGWRDRKRSNGGGNAVTPPVTGDPVTPLVTPPPTRPDPTRPSTYRLITTTTASTVGETAAAAVEIYATADLATRPIDEVKRRPSYRNGIVTRVLTEHGGELTAYVAEHPHATPVDIACAVLGLDRASALRAERTMRQEAS